MSLRNPRYMILPSSGILMVSTDLHGNGEDYRRLEAWFLETVQEHPQTHWAILGDTVHGPDDRARRAFPSLYDYPDESYAIVDAMLRLKARFPEQIHYVLGNHDYGHIGGPHPAKFYPDEVAALEAPLDVEQRARLRALFESAYLALVAPCGALLCHGCPDDQLRALEDLNKVELPPSTTQPYQRALVEGFLMDYWQPPMVTARLLQTVSQVGHEITMVIHGHDRDPNGFYVDGGNQICPVIFGAARENKRFLRLDLSARYPSANALREDHEILRIYDVEDEDTLT